MTDTTQPNVGSYRTRCTRTHKGYDGKGTFRCPRQAPEGKSWCDHCRGLRANNRKRRAEYGMCECCSEPALPNRLRCLRHAKDARRYAKERRDKRIQECLCTECRGRIPAPATHGTMCEPCWFDSIAKSALRFTSPIKAREWGPRIRLIFYNQNGKCAYTGLDLIPGINASLDHKIPKALGGSDDLGNLQWVTIQVNLAKHAMSEEAFFSLCRNVLRHRGEL